MRSPTTEEQIIPSPADSRRPESRDSAGGESTRKRPIIRNQNACDACRARKVKCRFNDSTDTATACRICAELDIPCTFNRPRRRRGPPNKHVEQIRSSTDFQTPTAVSPDLAAHGLSPISPAEVVLTSPRLSNPSPSTRGHWLAMFAPMATIDHLLDEWFKQIHPVAPILHRRRFMHRLRHGDADHDRIFCGLVVSVCAATVATLRRSNYEPVTIQFCVEFVERHHLLHRGLLDPDYSLDWCIAMYNLGTALSAISGMDDLRAYHMACESASGVRYLAYYRLAEMDVLEQQLLKRLFWLLAAWSCSADLFGRISIALFMCEENFNHMHPLPLSDEQLDPEITDHSHLAADIAPWHGDFTSYVPGLIALSDLFMIWCQSRRQPQPSSKQGSKEALAEYLTAVQRVVDMLPPELRWRGGLSRPQYVTQGHDVQIANIFITSLHLKSNLLQKFGPAEGCGDEHQRIVDDLLEILYHMPHAIFDANGSSIVPKIRDIGAAYLEQVRIGQNNEVWISDTAKEKLERLLRKLDDLDFWPSMSLRGQGVAGSPNSLGSLLT